MKLSEATLTWEHWRARRRRRRQIGAWTGTAAFFLAVLAVMAWGGLPPLFNVGEKGEALLVKLGNPEGEDLPLSVSALPDPSLQAVMTAQRDTARTTVEETRPAQPEPAPAPAPVKTTERAPEKTPATPAKPPVTPAKPSPTPTPAPAPATPAVSDKPVVTEKVIRGSEKGNSSELVLKPQGEKISQNAYWPVYLFLPLPARLDASLLARVKATEDREGTILYSAEENRARLLEAYTRGLDLSLRADRGIETRPAIWAILEAAGYDVANADYKRTVVRPVVITFRIGVPRTPTSNPDLLEVKLEQSSGNNAVDEAVLYAFQKSSFANGTGQVAQGRYTYDFTAKR